TRGTRPFGACTSSSSRTDPGALKSSVGAVMDAAPRRTPMRRFIVAAATVFAMSASALAAENPHVIFETNLGNFEVELFADKAPLSTKNILEYVDGGFYDGLVFHRVIKGFMIQGGGMDAKLQQKQPRAPVKNEAGNGLKNVRGTLAMARTSDPDSGTSQFF